MKLIPVIAFCAGDKSEHYINLDHVCCISPHMDIDDFDNLIKSDSVTDIEFDSGLSLHIYSSYDDFIERLIEISEHTWGGF